jgi:protease-4
MIIVMYVFAAVGSLVVLGALLGGVVALWRWRRRKRLPRSMLLELDLHGAFVERSPQVRLAKLLGGDESTTVRSVITALDKARQDERVKGLIVRVGAPIIAPGHAQELRDALVRFRDSGRRTIATADTFGEGVSGNLSYYLATACAEVYLQPSGEVGVMGLRLEQPFVKRALQNLGVVPRFGQRESYKNAPNTFLESGLTEAHRESLTSLAHGVLGELALGMADGRKRPRAEVDAWFADGPFAAAEAKERGLVDDTLYRDQVYDKLKENPGDEVKLVFLERYAERAKDKGASKKAPTIAVIHGIGAVQRSGGSDGLSRRGDTFDAAEIAAAMRAARRKKSVKGVLLRVDSPGGSYVAADTVWREVEATRAAGKPVVVSMVNAAASGGYFVAAPATAVVAQPLTITGSIGVFGGKVVLEGLTRRFGVDYDGVQTHANADMNSAMHDYTPAQRAHLERSLDRIYADFTDKVARGRKLSAEQARAVAQGRVWTGREALQHKLVDALGGFDTALDLLKKELGVEPSTRLKLRDLPEQRSFWEKIWAKPPMSSEREGLEANASLGIVDVFERAQGAAFARFVGSLVRLIGF